MEIILNRLKSLNHNKLIKIFTRSSGAENLSFYRYWFCRHRFAEIIHRFWFSEKIYNSISVLKKKKGNWLRYFKCDFFIEILLIRSK